jgi:hypothetical protein
MNGKWIVVTGNLVDGFEFHGPFYSEEDAAEWAYDYCMNEWKLVKLSNPWQI